MIRLYVGSVGWVDHTLLEAADECLEHALGLEVRRMKMTPAPAAAYDAPRNQYNSALLLRALARACPGAGARLLALTEHDLFIPMFAFVFGQAELGGKAAIVSLARLRREFYGLPSNSGIVRARAAKEALHEVGHTLRLLHCLRDDCPMSSAPSLRQLDHKRAGYCDNCKSLLRENLNMLMQRSAEARG
jgi:archaemetzincin